MASLTLRAAEQVMSLSGLSAYQGSFSVFI
jgi:hypothetical protein